MPYALPQELESERCPLAAGNAPLLFLLAGHSRRTSSGVNGGVARAVRYLPSVIDGTFLGVVSVAPAVVDGDFCRTFVGVVSSRLL